MQKADKNEDGSSAQQISEECKMEVVRRKTFKNLHLSNMATQVGLYESAVTLHVGIHTSLTTYCSVHNYTQLLVITRCAIYCLLTSTYLSYFFLFIFRFCQLHRQSLSSIVSPNLAPVWSHGCQKQDNNLHWVLQ